MIKIIDIDERFDEYISKYVYDNIGKVKPEEIENQMPVLYEKFGKEKLEELDGKSPEEYYREESAEALLECLKEHIEKEVAVSDFLCEAIRDAQGSDKVIAKELEKENGEEFTLYLINMLSEKNSPLAVKRYLEFVVLDYSYPIRELASESLYAFADLVKEDILEQFEETSGDKRECLTDILSHASNDDRIFEILVNEFTSHQENIPLYAGLLGRYGDERAIPYLKEVAKNGKINYSDFEELRFAIESLGGECDVKRDFSKDKTYGKIKGIEKEKPVS